MKYRLGIVLAVVLSPTAAGAYVYTTGPNYVNLPGSSCRTTNASTEVNVRYDLGQLRVNPSISEMVVYCPIARRGTSFYGGKRLNLTFPPVQPASSALKANISGITLRASDGSTTMPLRCWTFGAGRTDQSIHFGTTKYLCSTSSGCTNPASVPVSWRGENTMSLAAPSGFSTVDTVNFGIACGVPNDSVIFYTESTVTPN